MLSEKFIFKKKHHAKIFFMAKKISISSRKLLAIGNIVQKNNCTKIENPNLCSSSASLYSPIYLIHLQDCG